MPRRERNKFYNFLYAYAEVVIFMDVAERRIGRSSDYQFQKGHYSGGHPVEKRVPYPEQPVDYQLSRRGYLPGKIY